MAKRKTLNAVQTWLHTQTGQTFLNLAYSWGAAIVILGALFKLTHMDGADVMLYIGMGTEVFVFFLSGFDTPIVDDEAIKAKASQKVDDPEFEVIGGDIDGVTEQAPEGTPVQQPVVIGGSGSGLGGGTIIINGGGATMPAGTVAAVGSADAGAAYQPAENSATEGAAPQAPVSAAQLANNIASVAVPQTAGMTPEMAAATEAYVDQLNQLTDILKQVAEQSARLTRDSEEMENMNRTLTGINRFYEMQLRDVGQQSATLDDVNAQTKRLAEQLEELNSLYARMVEALKLKIS